ncbi:NADH-quinone oxidoreductase subunit NuoE [Ignatzschineria cameli]|uniref:NADH-quinone oxidoreductase subunit E n=1 Tax=Ignatzschineria cameli TaxID=2182793 RepID=A0A2U2AR46_9GAMM|nr:NADH-quinone oxidoreductase subunit NuoE [Ignatzschineria cameli]PWD85303.1 NAD(P)H-dependent oxidoreductase subunit E [Ignatzschineria cameli]PWD86272.1 NAD(P)H-dependent oxidoreductase subunit E [Ignatzschineria cameli]PWD89890.1 NAD(P)H-dependent oxidoreductase subunit E [Ignatzschineria cameli]PWD91540.1 NAD(P)H-dependent oxidoreductase subunit E [Ignatzschineria cameli]PWD92578.1 NAD(P)H-dependent oxidoreductase subunit E [Ignatzschineria cameli]
MKNRESILSSHTRAEIDRWLARFPEDRKQSALLAALREAQHENGGYLTVEIMDAIAEYLELPPIAVYEVASFYSNFETKPCGKNAIMICTNISCMLRGGEEILAHVEKRLGIKAGESTPDGLFSLKNEDECIAACTAAPAALINHEYHENLTIEKIDEILDRIESRADNKEAN